MKQAPPLPFDVRLMQATAGVLLVVFGGYLCAALVVSVANHPALALAGITVTGDVARSNAATLRANVLPRLQGSFVTLDLARAKQAFEAVPWVRQAIVRRDFPGRLRVVLQEHRAVAYWGLEGDVRLLNSFGEVFEANLGEVEHEMLPRLQGPADQAPQVLTMYRALQSRFEGLDLSLEELDLSGRGSWTARLDSGARIELGRGSEEDITARTDRFLKTLTQVTARYNRRPEAVETADLRHADGYALRLRGVSTVVTDGLKK